VKKKEILVRGDELPSGVLRQAAELVNFVWLLARVHQRPEAVRFFREIRESDAPPPPARGGSPPLR
jgi:hypothetical protein